MQEGEAIFFRKSALELESSHDFAMRDAIPQVTDLKDLLKAFPSVVGIVADRLTTVAQVAVLRPTAAAAAAMTTMKVATVGDKDDPSLIR